VRFSIRLSFLGTFFINLLCLLYIFNFLFSYILDLNHATWSLLNLKLICVASSFMEQVFKVILNNLNKVATQSHFILLLAWQDIEHLNNWTSNKTWVFLWSMKSVRLAWSSLSISPDGYIKALNCALHNKTNIIKQLFLSRIRSKNRVKSIVFGSAFTVIHCQSKLIMNFDSWSCIILGFRLSKWSETAVYSDLTLNVFKFIQKGLADSLLVSKFDINQVKLTRNVFVSSWKLFKLILKISSLSCGFRILFDFLL